MKSAALCHFPQVVLRSHQKWLFNPVLKKRFKDRPEERVRLAWVEYLVRMAGFKKTRIGFENPVRSNHRTASMRADLILYNRSMEPFVLVECKSEAVPLNLKTAEQAARYNQTVKAPFMVLTNGVVDLWYRAIDGGVEPVANQLSASAAPDPLERDSEYWTARGFLKPLNNSGLNTRFASALNVFWGDDFPGDKRYLPFEQSVLPIPMSQFYRIIHTGEDSKLALTFLGYPQSGPYLVAVLNRKGVNAGIVIVDIEKLLSGDKRCADRYLDGKGVEQFSVDASLFDLKNFDAGEFKKLPQKVMNFFD